MRLALLLPGLLAALQSGAPAPGARAPALELARGEQAPALDWTREVYRLRYGAEVAPPEPLMRQLVEDFLMEGREKHAGDWLERYVAAYGEPQDFAELSARVEEVAALGEPAETVASLLALPRATPEEMKAHLGTWQGVTWLEDGPHDPVTVRFRVEDGTVQGELWHDVGPVIPLEYVRFRPDGALELGFRNGMRPRGLVMYEERTPGGPLEGEIPFRGIRFTPPPGASFPPPRPR